MKQEAHSHSSAVISWEDTWSLYLTSESSKPGEWPPGMRVSTRLRSSSSWSRALGPDSFLTMPAFPKVMGNIWRRDGKPTIGSRSRNFWLKCCGPTKERGEEKLGTLKQQFGTD